MSIEVPIAHLGGELERRSFGYLVTVGDDLRAHVVALRPRVVDHDDGPVVRFDAGSRRAAHNIAERPAVTIVFPPTDEGGTSLIVDGTAVADANHIDITPSWAVLHRDAPAIPDR